MIYFTVCASQKKGYKDRCLWSLSKSSSRNRDTIVNITSLDLVEDNAIQDKPEKLDEQEKKESNSPLKSIPSEFHSSKEVPKTDLIVQETHWQLERVASTKIQTAFRCYLVCSASLSMVVYLGLGFKGYGL